MDDRIRLDVGLSYNDKPVNKISLEAPILRTRILTAMLASIVIAVLLQDIFYSGDIVFNGLWESLDGRDFTPIPVPFYNTQTDRTRFFLSNFTITKGTGRQWIDVIADDCAEEIMVNGLRIRHRKGCNMELTPEEAGAEHREVSRIFLTERNNFWKGLNTIVVKVPNTGGLHSPAFFYLEGGIKYHLLEYAAVFILVCVILVSAGRPGLFPFAVLAFYAILYSNLKLFPLMFDFGGMTWTLGWLHGIPFILAFTIALLPGKYVAAFLGVFDSFKAGRLWLLWLAAVLAVASAAAASFFLGFPLSHQYGDYQTVPEVVYKGGIDAKEPLTFRMHKWFHDSVYARLGLDKNSGVTAYTESIRLLHGLLGGLFTAMAIALSTLLFKKSSERFVMAAALMSCFAVLCAFGSLDVYAVTITAMMAYIVSAVAYLKGKSSFLIPAAVLGVAVNLHMSLVWFAPTLLFLSSNGKKGEDFWRPFKMVFVFVLVAGLLYAPNLRSYYVSYSHVGDVLGYWIQDLGGGDGNLFKSPGVILSAYNANLVLTFLLVITPPALFLLAYCPMTSGWRCFSDDTSKFFAVLLAINLAYMIVHENDGPAQMDWNLYTNAALLTTLACLGVLRTEDGKIVALKTIAIVFLVYTLPMLMWNSM